MFEYLVINFITKEVILTTDDFERASKLTAIYNKKARWYKGGLGNLKALLIKRRKQKF